MIANCPNLVCCRASRMVQCALFLKLRVFFSYSSFSVIAGKENLLKFHPRFEPLYFQCSHDGNSLTSNLFFFVLWDLIKAIKTLKWASAIGTLRTLIRAFLLCLFLKIVIINSTPDCAHVNFV